MATSMKTHRATISASKFTLSCLDVIDDLVSTGRSITVTKHGKAFVRIVPIAPTPSIFGAMRGTGEVMGDIVNGYLAEWDAEQ